MKYLRLTIGICLAPLVFTVGLIVYLFIPEKVLDRFLTGGPRFGQGA